MEMHSKKRKLPYMEMECETEFVKGSTEKLLSEKPRDFSSKPDFHYCILQFAAVFAAISESVVCRKCHGDIEFLKGDVRGLGFRLDVYCRSCQNLKSVNSSPIVNTAYEINRRIVFAMYLLGQKLEGLQLFCGIMDLPKAICQTVYDTILYNVYSATTEVCKLSMRQAMREEVQLCNNNKVSCGQNSVVSSDGAGMKRNLSHIFAFVTLTGQFSKKIVDIIVSSLYCFECDTNAMDKTSTEYTEWFENHKSTCCVNNEESWTKLKANAVVQMFKRSPKFHGFQYGIYVEGDGCKIYSTIAKSKPYETSEVEERLCVSNAEKRMASFLIDIKKKSPRLGNGKFTADFINGVAKMYGNTISCNSTSLVNIKNAISTSLNNYKLDESMPQDIFNAINAAYELLNDDRTLSKYVGGFRIHINESLKKIWENVPKLATSMAIEISSAVAVSLFNDGPESYLRILQTLGITTGPHVTEYCNEIGDYC